uniref:CLP12 n=1 Tax=Sphyrna zygaena TaxID=195335 RepID=A0A146GF40_SPHZY|nr:CLP12 [Sphyrna zygaena]
MNRKLEMLPAPECRNRQCPDNWIHFNSSCYYFSHRKSAWNASSLYCSLRGTHLLIINNEQEQQFAALETRDRRFWVGLTDHSSQNKWQWVDGTDYETSPKFWMPGEPSSHHESCVHLWTDGLWNDAPCTGKEFFICEMEIQQ